MSLNSKKKKLQIIRFTLAFKSCFGSFQLISINFSIKFIKQILVCIIEFFFFMFFVFVDILLCFTFVAFALNRPNSKLFAQLRLDRKFYFRFQYSI